MSMGNLNYRITPLRTHNSEEGYCAYFDYGASQITGWRHKQEDRFVCIPEFHENFSFFAVYDGHAGGQVVQYVEQNLHQNILCELKLHKDPELALYLGFLVTDSSMRCILRKEIEWIMKDLDIEFEVPEKAERRAFLRAIRRLSARAITSRNDDTDAATKNDGVESAAASSDGAEPAVASNESTNAPGTSKEPIDVSNLENLKSEIVSACLNQLPSCIFLTRDPIVEEETDEEYEPEKDNIKRNYFESSGTEDEESSESDESSEDMDETEDEGSDENAEQSTNKEDDKETPMDICEAGEKKPAEQSESIEKHNCDVEAVNPGIAVSPECSADNGISSECQENKTPEKKARPEKRSKLVKPEDDEFGEVCGSTATVLLLSEQKIYIANVGDSRCVACINGEAVELSIDHKPSLKEEHARIIEAGGTVSADDRVNGYLDMSRCLGDFAFKQKDVAEPFQVLSAEPYVAAIDVTPNLEFIIVASDGIWNTMENDEVVNYIQNRMKDTGMELRDICAEMFEEMLPSQLNEDGTGCDNMTAILIQFKSFSEVYSAKPSRLQEVFTFTPHNKNTYLPESDSSTDMSPDMSHSFDMSTDQTDKQAEEVILSPDSEDHCEPGPMQVTHVPVEPISIRSPSPNYGDSDNEVARFQSSSKDSSSNSDDSRHPNLSPISVDDPNCGLYMRPQPIIPDYPHPYYTNEAVPAYLANSQNQHGRQPPLSSYAYGVCQFNNVPGLSGHANDGQHFQHVSDNNNNNSNSWQFSKLFSQLNNLNEQVFKLSNDLKEEITRTQLEIRSFRETMMDEMKYLDIKVTKLLDNHFFPTKARKHFSNPQNKDVNLSSIPSTSKASDNSNDKSEDNSVDKNNDNKDNNSNGEDLYNLLLSMVNSANYAVQEMNRIQQKQIQNQNPSNNVVVVDLTNEEDSDHSNTVNQNQNEPPIGDKNNEPQSRDKNNEPPIGEENTDP